MSSGASPRSDGKRALFSAAVRTPGTLVVECGSCFVKGTRSVGVWQSRSVMYGY